MDELKAKTDALQNASYKLAEEMYKNANPQGQQGGPEAGPQPGGGAQSGNGPSNASGADDADYEVVN